jgi:HSP20 family molecular chaperone IbpA
MNTQNQCCEGSSCNGADRSKHDPRFRCAVDIVEQADELVLYADVPGSSAEEIEVNLEEGILSISAAVKSRNLEGSRLLSQEYAVGGFSRSFRISETIDPAGIRAEYSNGVLKVHLPKVATAKPRKISVTTH